MLQQSMNFKTWRTLAWKVFTATFWNGPFYFRSSVLITDGRSTRDLLKILSLQEVKSAVSDAQCSAKQRWRTSASTSNHGAVSDKSLYGFRLVSSSRSTGAASRRDISRFNFHKIFSRFQKVPNMSGRVRRRQNIHKDVQNMEEYTAMWICQNSGRHFKAFESTEPTIYTVETFESSHITIQQRGI